MRSPVNISLHGDSKTDQLFAMVARVSRSRYADQMSDMACKPLLEISGKHISSSGLGFGYLTISQDILYGVVFNIYYGVECF